MLPNEIFFICLIFFFRNPTGAFCVRAKALSTYFKQNWPRGVGGGSTPYDGLYGEAPPGRGIFFTLKVYERVGISLAEVYKRVGKKSVTWVCERAQKGEQMNFMAL